MKKVLLMSMLALVVLGCNKKSSKDSDDNDNVEVTRTLDTEEFRYEKNTPHASANVVCDFPTGGDEELRKMVYDCMTYKIAQSLGESETDDFRDDGQGFVDHYGTIISKDLETEWNANWSDGDGSGTLADDVFFSLIDETDKYVTFKFIRDCYYGGDGYRGESGVTFTKGEECFTVTNDFLFKNPSSPKLLKLVRQAIVNNYGEGFVDQEILDGIDSLPAESFYIADGGLAFYYGQYEVFYMGLAGNIPYEKVEDLLTDEALELFEE